MLLLNQFLSAVKFSFSSLTDLEGKMKGTRTVFLLLLLFANTMDARRKDGRRRKPYNYGENECTPCQGKLKMSGSPSVLPEPLP